MKKIWSNLGINVEEFNSSSKVIEEANLSYLVNKAPAYAFINGDYVRIKNSFATFKAVALIESPNCCATFDSKSMVRSSAGSTVTMTSLDSKVPAIAALINFIASSLLFT